MSDAATHDRPTVRAATILAVAIVLAAAMLAWGLARVRLGDDQVSVTGSARRTLTSDLVVWNLSVSATRPALGDALRDANLQAERVRAFLRAQRVSDSSVATAPLSTETVNEVQNGNETGRVSAYRITERFTVTTRDVAGITAVVAKIADLVTQGVPVNSQAPEYLVSQLPEVRVALLGDAVKDARARAEQIATAAGTSVGRVKSVTVGVFQVRKPNSMSLSDYGGYDTESREKDVTVAVHVTFTFR
jgi:hypothetical protein